MIIPSMYVSYGRSDGGRSHYYDFSPDVSIKAMPQLQLEVFGDWNSNQDNTQWIGNFRDRWPERNVGQLFVRLCRRARHDAAADVGAICVNMKIETVMQGLVVEMNIGNAAVDVTHIIAPKRVAEEPWALSLFG